MAVESSNVVVVRWLGVRADMIDGAKATGGLVNLRGLGLAYLRPEAMYAMQEGVHTIDFGENR